MGYQIDITGKKFNRLQILGFSHNHPKNRSSIWICLCDCGNIKNIQYNAIVKNRIKSCGCLLKESRKLSAKHGLTKHPMYRRWASMKQRCNSEKVINYDIYGGRGITYCLEWEDFENFYRDMVDGFHPDLELDRIDVNKNYCKENCRWTTHEENNYNKTRQTNNKSGKSGVSYDRSRQQWRAYINKDKKRIELGYFNNYKDAVEVRVLEELELYGYTRP